MFSKNVVSIIIKSSTSSLPLDRAQPNIQSNPLLLGREVFSRIWELHEKLSDTIHSISRSQFRSTKALYVDDVDQSALEEAKSLNHIRTALENLEENLQFFHTVENQQRAERDAAIARLEQSRIVLAMRLSCHHGKNYNVIEEAQAFVGDVNESTQFVAPEVLYGESAENFVSDDRKKKNSNVLNFLWSKVKSTLKLDQLGGVIGNVALVALSMLVLMHVEQAGKREDYSFNPLQWQEDVLKRGVGKVSRPEDTSSPDCSTQLDVMLARG